MNSHIVRDGPLTARLRECWVDASNLIDCDICGEPAPYAYGFGLPTFNGDIVSNDFPNELWRQHGGGVPVCEDCYRKHERGEMPTFDHYYIPRSPFGVLLMNGAGI